jgi:hypothetical protein
MVTSQGSDSAPAHPDANATTPNQYHLHGDGIAVSYFPEGFGPVVPPGGARLVYQDNSRTLNVTGQGIRTVAVPDLGTVVSVTLVETIDLGNTTFSLVVPQVVLPPQPGAVPVHTEGITTVHRTFLGAIGHAQRETYTVTPLVGMASRGILAM